MREPYQKTFLFESEGKPLLFHTDISPSGDTIRTQIFDRQKPATPIYSIEYYKNDEPNEYEPYFSGNKFDKNHFQTRKKSKVDRCKGDIVSIIQAFFSGFGLSPLLLSNNSGVGLSFFLSFSLSKFYFATTIVIALLSLLYVWYGLKRSNYGARIKPAEETKALENEEKKLSKFKDKINEHRSELEKKYMALEKKLNDWESKKIGEIDKYANEGDNLNNELTTVRKKIKLIDQVNNYIAYSEADIEKQRDEISINETRNKRKGILYLILTATSITSLILGSLILSGEPGLLLIAQGISYAVLIINCLFAWLNNSSAKKKVKSESVIEKIKKFFGLPNSEPAEKNREDILKEMKESITELKKGLQDFELEEEKPATEIIEAMATNVPELKEEEYKQDQIFTHLNQKTSKLLNHQKVQSEDRKEKLEKYSFWPYIFPRAVIATFTVISFVLGLAFPNAGGSFFTSIIWTIPIIAFVCQGALTIVQVFFARRSWSSKNYKPVFEQAINSWEELFQNDPKSLEQSLDDNFKKSSSNTIKTFINIYNKAKPLIIPGLTSDLIPNEIQIDEDSVDPCNLEEWLQDQIKAALNQSDEEQLDKLAALAQNTSSARHVNIIHNLRSKLHILANDNNKPFNWFDAVRDLRQLPLEGIRDINKLISQFSNQLYNTVEANVELADDGKRKHNADSIENLVEWQKNILEYLTQATDDNQEDRDNTFVAAEKALCQKILETLASDNPNEIASKLNDLKLLETMIGQVPENHLGNIKSIIESVFKINYKLKNKDHKHALKSYRTNLKSWASSLSSDRATVDAVKDKICDYSNSFRDHANVSSGLGSPYTYKAYNGALFNTIEQQSEIGDNQKRPRPALL